MPDIREEFEAWVQAAMGGFADLRKSDDKNYAYDDADVDFAYQAWQASRAAQKVELPRPYGQSLLDIDPDFEQYNRGIRDCKEALQKAGIEVVK